jgi:hypothetical protein
MMQRRVAPSESASGPETDGLPGPVRLAAPPFGSRRGGLPFGARVAAWRRNLARRWIDGSGRRVSVSTQCRGGTQAVQGGWRLEPDSVVAVRHVSLSQAAAVPRGQWSMVSGTTLARVLFSAGPARDSRSGFRPRLEHGPAGIMNPSRPTVSWTDP